MSGKLKNSTYKVYIAPGDSGTKYYSMSKAVEAGFKADESHDGRKKRGKKPKKWCALHRTYYIFFGTINSSFFVQQYYV